MIFMVFLWFHHKNWLLGNFHYYIRNQLVKIRKYGEFKRNRKVHLFGTAHLMGFDSFFHLKISFFLKNNGFREKMYTILKIDLLICYNFCRKYLFPRSIIIDIKRKNLLKTFFFSYDLENPLIFGLLFMNYLPIPNFTSCGYKNLHFMGPKIHYLFDSI